MRRAPFIATIFLNSALLFLVQPLIARMILPIYGGSPSVWTASMVFFQAFLLLGYGYAHATTKWLPPKKQAWVHVALLAIAALTLPFALPTWSGAVGSGDPTLNLLATLAVTVGPTFFAISAGAPLIQRWFSTTDDKEAQDPYFLYSASNIGSLLALLAYPLLLEPTLRLHQQGALWARIYLLLVLCVGGLIFAVRRPKESPPAAVAEGTRITRQDRLLWLCLAAVPSSMLLGATSFLTTNIAPVPLLWVVPLSLYLLTYILAFAKHPLLTASVLGRVAPLIGTPLLMVILLEAGEPITAMGLFHLAGFFALAWMCHRRLVESRPSAEHLTEFYLWISVGGVVGGIFNALVAPVIFSKLYEYPFAVAAALMLRPTIAQSTPKAWQRSVPAFALLLALLAGWLTTTFGMPAGTLRTLLTIGVPLVMGMVVMDWPVLAGLAAASAVLASVLLKISPEGQLVVSRRSFFGVHQVRKTSDGRFYELAHGNTTHGKQDRRHPETPLTYYHPSGPVGSIFRAYSPERVALVGLGVGAIAAYGERGQRMTFYEIDPVVREIATDPRLFTFIRDSKAAIDFVIGDARLTLAKEPNASFSLLVLDAFSSDAIPIHLLTLEAFQMYLLKLAPGGLIAIHVSNRYLNLPKVLKSEAKDLHLQAAMYEDGATMEEKDAGKLASKWVVFARKEADLAPLLADPSWNQLYDEPVRTWTDDYSNVLSVFDLDQ